MKILIIEDEKALRETVRESLLREKFVVECAEDYPTAMSKINDYDYDCILLDIMLPGGSGLSILARLKQMRKQESVIIISAKDSIEDKVEGLNLGADDYLAKPFHLAELNARVKSLLRRKKAGGDTSIIIGNLTVYPDTREAKINGEPLLLNRKEINRLSRSGKETGFTIVPMRLFINDRGLAKLVIGIGRGKKEYDKRQSIKEREDKRSMARMFQKK